MYHFCDFKGFKQVGIDLLRPFTLLIGPNGSGRPTSSKQLSCFPLSHGVSPSMKLPMVGHAATGLQIRGGLQACGRTGLDIFVLRFKASVKLDSAFKPVAYELYICTKPHPQILREELIFDGRTIYETLFKNPKSASRDLAVRYDNFARGGRKPQTAASSERSVLSQYREIAEKNLNLKSAFSWCVSSRTTCRLHSYLIPIQS